MRLAPFEELADGLPTSLDRLISVLIPLGFLIVFGLLYYITRGWPSVPALWPRLVLLSGIVVSTLLIVKELIFSEEESSDLVSQYLSGGESLYSSSEQIKRLAMTAMWIIIFFPLGSVNLYLAITVCFAGMMLSLGIREPKRIVGGVIILDGFVFVIFQQALNMPIRVF